MNKKKYIRGNALKDEPKITYLDDAMNIENLKELATKDTVNNQGEIGFSENSTVLVTARKVGANKPNRKSYIKYIITNKV